jgi:hypothetical protein
MRRLFPLQGAEAPPTHPAAANLQHTALQHLEVDHRNSEEPLLEDMAAAVNRLAAAAPNIVVLDHKSGPCQGGVPDFALMPNLRWLTLAPEGHDVDSMQLRKLLAPLKKLQGLELGVSFEDSNPMILAVKLWMDHGVALQVIWRHGFYMPHKCDRPYAFTMRAAGMNCRFLYDDCSVWEEMQRWRTKLQKLD